MQYFVTVNPGIREGTGQGGGRECSGGGGRGARGRVLGALGARGWRQGAAPGAQAWGGAGLVGRRQSGRRGACLEGLEGSQGGEEQV